MSSRLRIALAALLTLVPACKREAPKPAPAARAPTCAVSLVEHCGPRGCPSFETRAAELRTQVAAHYDAGSCLSRAAIGTCGELQYVEYSDGYHGRTDYFDASGKQVAGEEWSDIGSCDGKADKAIAGALPSCTPKPREILCPRPDSAQ